jgi:RNA recognition motif-containing protein
MGVEKSDSSSESVKSTQTNDHSNPQQGTGATKTIMQEKQDHGRRSNNDRNTFAQKSNATPQPNHGKDKRKLFVGGLPTDITDPEFRYFFSQFGELHESVVMFDRVTRRSRGFGFVTYVNPAVSQSLLQMGNHGDGIGRLVMMGKTCEVKPAAPKGQAPTRGGKAYQNNRSGTRNQHQGQLNQVSAFGGPNEQFPVIYQNENYNLFYPQGVYSATPGVPGYAPPVYHHHVPHPSHPQLHSPRNGSIPLNADCNLGENCIVGPSYFFGSSLPAPPPERFSGQNAFPPAPQILAHYHQQGYAFVPYVPDHTQQAIPVMEMATMTQPMEPSTHANEEVNSNDEGFIEVEKE